MASRSKPSWQLTLSVALAVTMLACGAGHSDFPLGDGGTGSSGGGSGSSSSGGDGTGSGGSGGGIGVTGTPSMGGGSSGGAGGGCDMSSAGTCSDGSEFDINCSCPAGTCTCSKQTRSGTQTSHVSIACPQACSLGGGDSLVQACNFGSSQGTVTPPADAGLPACTIPASMEPPSEPYAWSVGRALLNCQGAGLNTICMSSDGTTCPGNPVTVGSSCTDDCAPDEYAVAYGGPPP